MIALFACILANLAIAILFKLFPRYGVNAFNAIIVNYTVCLVLGTFYDEHPGLPFRREVLHETWFLYDMVLGVLFICGFNLIAAAIRQSGITVTTLMQKMSLVLTVIFTFTVYHEPLNLLKAIGLVLALIAIIAIQWRKDFSWTFRAEMRLLILFIVWISSAAIEIILYHVERSGQLMDQHVAFTTHGFGCAALIGWVVLLVNSIRGRHRMHWREFAAGLLLGIPNFFSIYLLLYLLKTGWNGSLMYPAVNVMVLIFSTFIAVLAFKEKLEPRNWAGILSALLAIAIIGYSEYSF